MLVEVDPEGGGIWLEVDSTVGCSNLAGEVLSWSATPAMILCRASSLRCSTIVWGAVVTTGRVEVKVEVVVQVVEAGSVACPWAPNIDEEVVAL